MHAISCSIVVKRDIALCDVTALYFDRRLLPGSDGIMQQITSTCDYYTYMHTCRTLDIPV